MTLNEFFSLVPKAAVAFSGGNDSAFLLWAAKKCGCDVRAYYVKTPFQPQFELEDARRLASELAVPMTVVEADILAVPEAAANGPQRCYHGKTALFSQLRQAAREDGYTVLLDGTNASDDAGDRPGMRALRELEVRSPLRECGLTKEEVRRRSREAGLFTWDKPAGPPSGLIFLTFSWTWPHGPHPPEKGAQTWTTNTTFWPFFGGLPMEPPPRRTPF